VNTWDMAIRILDLTNDSMEIGEAFQLAERLKQKYPAIFAGERVNLQRAHGSWTAPDGSTANGTLVSLRKSPALAVKMPAGAGSLKAVPEGREAGRQSLPMFLRAKSPSAKAPKTLRGV